MFQPFILLVNSSGLIKKYKNHWWKHHFALFKNNKKSSQIFFFQKHDFLKKRLPKLGKEVFSKKSSQFFFDLLNFSCFLKILRKHKMVTYLFFPKSSQFFRWATIFVHKKAQKYLNAVFLQKVTDFLQSMYYHFTLSFENSRFLIFFSVIEKR